MENFVKAEAFTRDWSIPVVAARGVPLDPKHDMPAYVRVEMSLGHFQSQILLSPSEARRFAEIIYSEAIRAEAEDAMPELIAFDLGEKVAA